MDKSKVLMFFSILILILSSLSFGGCLDDKEDGVVGIPEGKDPQADINESHVEITVEIMNTYEEQKHIVMKFKVGTLEERRYSKNQFITLPKDSQEEYSQVVEIPKNATAKFVDTEIIVNEDETKIIDVKGESNDASAIVNATIANTNSEQQDITIRFEVESYQSEYAEIKKIDLPESSMDEYFQKIDIPDNETIIDYRAEII